MDADRAAALASALRSQQRPQMQDGTPLTAEQYHQLLLLKQLHEDGTTRSPFQGVFTGTGPRPQGNGSI
jgi:hypothetical protein